MVAFTSSSALVDRWASAVGSGIALTVGTGRGALSDFLKRLSGNEPLKPPPAPERKKEVEFCQSTIEIFYDASGKIVPPYPLDGHMNQYMALSQLRKEAKELLEQYGGKVPGDQRMQLVISKANEKDLVLDLTDLPSNNSTEKLTEELSNYLSKPHGKAAIDAITSQYAKIDVNQDGEGGTSHFPNCLSVRVVLRDF